MAAVTSRPSAVRHDALTARIKADVAEAESRIDKARDEAIGNIQTGYNSNF